MTIDNENNVTIMNLSKITKVNETITNDMTHNKLSKKQSMTNIQSAGGPNTRIGSHIQNNNTVFMGQQVQQPGGNSQVIFPSASNHMLAGA